MCSDDLLAAWRPRQGDQHSPLSHFLACYMLASQCGERDAARPLFAMVWDDIGGEGGDPLHRFALAHSIADVQDDVNEELVRDLRALATADLLTDEHAAQAGCHESRSRLLFVSAPQPRTVLPQARRQGRSLPADRHADQSLTDTV